MKFRISQNQRDALGEKYPQNKHLRLHEGYLILAHNNDSKLTPKTHLIKADNKCRKMRPGVNERYQEDHLWTC